MQTVVAEAKGFPTVTESTSMIAQKPGIGWPTEQAKLDLISEKPHQPRRNIPFSSDIYNLT